MSGPAEIEACHERLHRFSADVRPSPMLRTILRGDGATMRWMPRTLIATAAVALSVGLPGAAFGGQGRLSDHEPIVFSVRGLTCGAVGGLG
jgi:hypothetical protein